MNTIKYLKEETAKLEKKANMTSMIGMVITAIVICYTILALWYVNVMTEPFTLARFILTRFKEEAPKVITATEMKLIESAPDVANHVSKSVQYAIPQFRYKAQKFTTKLLDEKFKKAEESVSELTEAYFKAHADKFTSRKKNESVEAYGKRTANTLADIFGESLNKQLKVSIGKEIYDLNSGTENLLCTLNMHLKKLSSTEFSKLSRGEQLESIIISHIINKYLRALPQS